MNISAAASRSGLSTKTIRYYEDIGLIAPAQRAQNGYRQYDENSVNELRFLAHARDVGFDLHESKQLLELLRNPKRQSRHARVLVLEKSRQLEERIQQLLSMREQLMMMANRCHGDEGPDCAILAELVADR
ncbi:MAG: Cu(I)-responsive transcriptional regulator [Pseudomonadota bacterium]